MNANESIYLFAVWARGTHFSMLFGNNSSDVCWTQIRMTGVLLCTTRCIHRTHSKLGRSSPLGVGMHLCFFVCHYFCTRMQTKRVDLQIFCQDVGVDRHGKQSMRHYIFCWGSRGGLGARFCGRHFPFLKCMEYVTPLLETVCP